MLTMIKGENKYNENKVFGFTAVNNKVVKNPDFRKLSAQTKWVYTILCSYSNSKGKSVWPSYQRVATDAGTSRCIVKRAVKVLVNAGFIFLQPRGAKKSNLISFKTPNETSKLEPYLVSDETLDKTETRVLLEPLNNDKLGSNETLSRVYTEPLVGSNETPRTKERTKERKENIYTDDSEIPQVDLFDIPITKTKPKKRKGNPLPGNPDTRIKDHTKWAEIYKKNIVGLWMDHWVVFIGTKVVDLSAKDSIQGKNILNKADQDTLRAGLIIRQAFNEYHKQAPNGVWPFNKGQAPTLDKICNAYLKLDAMIPKETQQEYKPVKTQNQLDLEKRLQLMNTGAKHE